MDRDERESRVDYADKGLRQGTARDRRGDERFYKGDMHGQGSFFPPETATAWISPGRGRRARERAE